jgi:hypothetical protein
LINKTFESVAAALDGIADGSVIMVGGFGTAGMPSQLVDGVIASGARDLTIISNNAGNGEIGLAALLKAGRVAKVICSFPRQSDSYVFDELYLAGKVQLEVVPQGNLAERIRAAGSGSRPKRAIAGATSPIAKPREILDRSWRWQRKRQSPRSTGSSSWESWTPNTLSRRGSSFSAWLQCRSPLSRMPTSTEARHDCHEKTIA